MEDGLHTHPIQGFSSLQAKVLILCNRPPNYRNRFFSRRNQPDCHCSQYEGTRNDTHENAHPHMDAFIVQLLLLFAMPVISVALFLLTFDRLFGANFFNVAEGADPLLWQHLFWIFGHPEVYVLILPSFGVISEIIPTFSRKPIFGYPFMVFPVLQLDSWDGECGHTTCSPQELVQLP